MAIFRLNKSPSVGMSCPPDNRKARNIVKNEDFQNNPEGRAEACFMPLRIITLAIIIATRYY
jgi:hypothetical protein